MTLGLSRSASPTAPSRMSSFVLASSRARADAGCQRQQNQIRQRHTIKRGSEGGSDAAAYFIHVAQLFHNLYKTEHSAYDADSRCVASCLLENARVGFGSVIFHSDIECQLPADFDCIHAIHYQQERALQQARFHGFSFQFRSEERRVGKE